MQVKSQSLMPAHINFSSGVNHKSQGAAPKSHLSISTKDDKQLVSGRSQTRAAKLDVSIIKCQWEELDRMLSKTNRGDSVWINKALIDIERAIAGGPGSPNFVLNGDGAYSGEEHMQNFLTGMSNSGDQQNAYIVLADKLAGKNGSGEKDLNAFTSFAAKLSSKDLQTFLKTYQVSPVALTGEAGQALMDFAADLSGDDMKNFITAVDNSPKDLQNIINTGSKLSKDDLSNFLAAARNAGEDVSILTGRIDKILSKQQDHGQVNLSSYLSTAAKTGTQVIDFVNATKSISPETTDNIATFLNHAVGGKTNIKNFISIIHATSEESINTIIDVSSTLGEKDKSNLLDTAARAGSNLGQFVQSLTEFTNPTSGHSTAEFSNFLNTATKAEGNLDILVKMSGKLDLAFTSNLSAVDTVNFLDAAEKAGGNLDKLTKLGRELLGSDRSNFFYAAAQTGDGLGKFLAKTASLTGDDKSQFLLSSANKGEEKQAQAIYMKGLLTAEEYDKFQKSAEMVPANQISDMADITAGLKGSVRSDFLETAVVSKEKVGELINILKPLSQDKQKAFIGLAKGLGEENLGKVIKAVGNANENFSDFISLAEELKQSDRTGFGHFLSASENASSDDLKGLINIVNKLGVRQQSNNRSGIDMRHSFLMVASDAGHNLNGLIDMANNLISMSPSDFVEIFDSAEAATGKYLGTFIKAYV